MRSIARTFLLFSLGVLALSVSARLAAPAAANNTTPRFVSLWVEVEKYEKTGERKYFYALSEDGTIYWRTYENTEWCVWVPSHKVQARPSQVGNLPGGAEKDPSHIGGGHEGDHH